jgi:glutaredoxin-related protein
MSPGEHLATENRCTGELDARADALRALNAAGISYVVAGAYAFFEYTGIFRDTKDLDVFLRRRDVEIAFDALREAGFRCEMTDDLWIGKAYRGEWFVDLIFSSGNGVAVVDEAWFDNARSSEVMGVTTLLAPPEEMIWSKGFVCERERYDGNDVANLIRAVGHEMSWERLLDRFGEHWEVLLSHLIMYRFSFPGERTQVPRWVMEELLRRGGETLAEGNWERRICRGRLVSRTQYEHAVKELGYEDARAEVISRARRGTDDVAELPAGRDR